jgi:hypothetical protein
VARKRIVLDDPDDEVLPASPRARRAATTFGCVTIVILLALLAWFVATHTATVPSTGIFGS